MNELKKTRSSANSPSGSGGAATPEGNVRKKRKAFSLIDDEAGHSGPDDEEEEEYDVGGGVDSDSVAGGNDGPSAVPEVEEAGYEWLDQEGVERRVVEAGDETSSNHSGGSNRSNSDANRGSSLVLCLEVVFEHGNFGQ